MASTAIDVLKAALAEFSAASRLFALTVGEGGAATDALMVEAFAAHDAVQEVGVREVIALSTSVHLPVASLLGQQAVLDVALADGTRTRFSGEVSACALLGSDGGLARYRLRISPWLWRLGHMRNCRIWQDKSVIEIVDAVFAASVPLARWRWSEGTNAFMAQALPRSYCCQYRESDLAFVSRLLAEEGLGWRVEELDDGHRLVLFADSSAPRGLPDDPSSAATGGIRYHGVSSVEHADTVQALQTQRRLHASLSTVASSDYKTRRIVSANSPSHTRYPKLPELESYDVPGQYAYANGEQARRYADLQMQGKEARGETWTGRSTVRTLRAGTRMTITGAPLRQPGATPAFTILRVHSVGINNMPPAAQHALAELFGPIPELLERLVTDASPDIQAAIAQARLTGYANCFEAIPAALVWRPALPGSDGRTHAKPTAHGAQSAIVVGQDGGDVPNGANELACDRLGRVRIRFHWQDGGTASCWVRVAQRAAGGGTGFQFLPRIGHEVLVQFLENDIDRPIVVGGLYNGQGEGGIAPTPGGQPAAQAEADVFAPANDHATSAQGNRAGGNSPVWHGASPDSPGHRNGAGQWGIRSKEFGGAGYSQLLFDDTDGQGRVQLRCSHAATELNLGHLIHSADNYRGSFRGLGAELRTDAYGAVRAGAGLLVSSYKINHGASARDAAGDNAAGVGLIEHALKVAGTFHKAATTHQTVGLAAHAGAVGADASVLDEKAAPLRAMAGALAGRVDAQGFAKAEGGGLPHLGEPLIAIAAKDGLGVVAGQSVQLVAGETVSLLGGQDVQFVSGGRMRVHTGQALGVLGGAVKAGEGGVGLQMIAATDAIDVQAQADELMVQARDRVDVMSANAHIDWVAAKSITLSTAGGASIVIDGGNITVQCPGKIKVQAGKKSFAGPAKLDYPLPALPTSICVECLIKARKGGSPFVLRSV